MRKHFTKSAIGFTICSTYGVGVAFLMTWLAQWWASAFALWIAAFCSYGAWLSFDILRMIRGERVPSRKEER